MPYNPHADWRVDINSRAQARGIVRMIVNWDALGTIAEIIGATMVVVSVVYLAVQVRENTKLSAEEVVSSAIDAFTDLDRMIAADSDLASILIRGEQALPSLSPEEQRRFDSLISIEFSVYERWHTKSGRSGLGREHDELMRFMLGERLCEAGISRWWRDNHEWFPPSFVEWTNSIVHSQSNNQSS